MEQHRLNAEVYFEAVRSRGPGGQNVNKVSSAAVLYWAFEYSCALNQDEKHLVREKLASYINKENLVYVRSDEFRDLEKNKTRCLEKLKHLLDRALFKPKTRKPSKPTRASKIKKLESKRRRGDIKRSRQGRWS